MIEWVFSPVLRKFPGHQGRPRRRRDRMDPVLPRTVRAGRRQAPVLDRQRRRQARLPHGPRRGQTRRRRSISRASPSSTRSVATSTAASSTTSHGVRTSMSIGVDNVMIETDYPHSDSTWPNCLEHAQEAAGWPAQTRTDTRSCGAMPSACSGSLRPTGSNIAGCDETRQPCSISSSVTACSSTVSGAPPSHASDLAIAGGQVVEVGRVDGGSPA